MDTLVALSTIVTAIAALVGLPMVYLQLRMANKSFRADHERRKKQATIEHIREIRPLYNRASQRLDATYGTDLLSEAIVTKIVDDDQETREHLKQILTLLEYTAVGANIGVFDKDLWYRMSGTYLIRLYHRVRRAHTVSRLLQWVQRGESSRLRRVRGVGHRNDCRITRFCHCRLPGALR